MDLILPLNHIKSLPYLSPQTLPPPPPPPHVSPPMIARLAVFPLRHTSTLRRRPILPCLFFSLPPRPLVCPRFPLPSGPAPAAPPPSTAFLPNSPLSSCRHSTHQPSIVAFLRVSIQQRHCHLIAPPPLLPTACPHLPL